MLFGCHCSKQTGVPSTTDPSAPTVEKPKPQMPKGSLLRVTSFYQGMMMQPFSRFNLHRDTVAGTTKLAFYHYSNETECVVSDTLLDAARSIIEEEKMYEYAPEYSLKLDERILDGYHWGFTADFEGDEHLSSGGSNVSPGGNGISRLERLLFEAARACVEPEKNEE